MKDDLLSNRDSYSLDCKKWTIPNEEQAIKIFVEKFDPRTANDVRVAVDQAVSNGKHQDVILYINSKGEGDVANLNAMLSYIWRHKDKVKVHAVGLGGVENLAYFLLASVTGKRVVYASTKISYFHHELSSEAKSTISQQMNYCPFTDGWNCATYTTALVRMLRSVYFFGQRENYKGTYDKLFFSRTMPFDAIENSDWIFYKNSSSTIQRLMRQIHDVVILDYENMFNFYIQRLTYSVEEDERVQDRRAAEKDILTTVNLIMHRMFEGKVFSPIDVRSELFIRSVDQVVESYTTDFECYTRHASRDVAAGLKDLDQTLDSPSVVLTNQLSCYTTGVSLVETSNG